MKLQQGIEIHNFIAELIPVNKGFPGPAPGRRAHVVKKMCNKIPAFRPTSTIVLSIFGSITQEI